MTKHTRRKERELLQRKERAREISFLFLQTEREKEKERIYVLLPLGFNRTKEGELRGYFLLFLGYWLNKAEEENFKSGLLEIREKQSVSTKQRRMKKRRKLLQFLFATEDRKREVWFCFFFSLVTTEIKKEEENWICWTNKERRRRSIEKRGEFLHFEKPREFRERRRWWCVKWRGGGALIYTQTDG